MMNKKIVNLFIKNLIALTIIFLILLFIYFVEWSFLPRLIISLDSLSEKGLYYFNFLFNKTSEVSSLTDQYLSLGYFAQELLEIDLDKIRGKIKISFSLLVNIDFIKLQMLNFSNFMLNISKSTLVITLLFVVIIIIFAIYLSSNEKTWNETSKPLKIYFQVKKKVLIPMFQVIKNYILWFKDSIYLYILCSILIIGFNIPSIVLDIIGEYLYFFSSFNIYGLIDFIFVEILTILGSLNFLPAIIKLFSLFGLIRYLTIRRAYRLIEGKLMVRNEKMVNSDTGVFTLILGKMRGGKTTLATSIARISNTIYHKNAFENMTRISLMFPNFPFIALEKDIIRLAKRKRLVNMQQCARFVSKIYDISLSKPFVLYGYNVNEQKSLNYDGCVNLSLRDALIIYAESYWIYFQKGNLIASNYPIRTDDIRLDNGHLVLWDYNSFRRNNRDLRSFSEKSRILVFDMLRLGRKVNPLNKFKDSNGPMIAVATEFGKENGNMLTNANYSAMDETANPKNDLLDYSLKLGGHLANVWHTNFFKFIADEQRSGSISTNLVSVAQSIYTADPKNQKEKSALKLFYIEPAILDAFINLRNWFYSKYRFVREDNTLLFHIINWLGSFAYYIESYIYNRFGYKEVELPSCRADATGNLIEGDKQKFYIIYYIDYSLRFESACMKDFLNSNKLKADTGFFDIPEYKSMMPTKEEWESQGSYIVKDLENPLLKFNPKVKARCKNGSRQAKAADRSETSITGGIQNRKR